MKVDSDLTFKERNTNRVDIAQIKAEEYIKSKGVYYKIIGFDSKESPIPYGHWKCVPKMLQKMPDMFIVSGEHFHFVEVKGCRNYLKVKMEDYGYYQKWDEIGDTLFLVYSTVYNGLYVFDLHTMSELFTNSELKKYEDNQKLYYNIPVTELEPYRRSIESDEEE